MRKSMIHGVALCGYSDKLASGLQLPNFSKASGTCTRFSENPQILNKKVQV